MDEPILEDFQLGTQSSQVTPDNATTIQPLDDKPVVDCEVIDDEGDVMLRSGVKGFLVSSKVLTLASSVFKAMLKSDFAEGHALRSSTVPLPIDVNDDNLAALAVVLHTIHFSKKQRYSELNVDMQFEVAVLSDKYDFARALYSDSQRWLMSINAETQSVSSLWKLVAVTYLMYHPVLFAQQNRQLARVLDAEDLNSPLPQPSLPTALREALQSARDRLLDRMIEEVERTMNDLRNNTRRSEMQVKECSNCRNWKPLQAKKCHQCSNTEFYDVYCDAGSRLCGFIGSLDSAHMWPLSRWRKKSAINFLIKMKTALPQTHQNCSEIDECLLIQRSHSLEMRLELIIKQDSDVNFKANRFETSV